MGIVSWRRANDKQDIVFNYVRFVHRYASTLMGARRLHTYFKSYPMHTIFDALDPSDEAFACLILRNNYKLWRAQYRKIANECDEALQDRGSRTDTGSDLDSDDSSDAEDNSDNDIVRPKYTGGLKTRTKNKYLQSGWSDEGKKYYTYLLTQIRSRDKENTENAGEYRRVWLRHYGNSFINKKDSATVSEPQQDTEERREAPIMFSDDEDFEGEEDNEIEEIKNRTYV
jgi:hypothetical protein